MKEKNKSITQDAIRVLIPKLAPGAAKMILTLVPSGSSVDKFLANYHSYFATVAPAIVLGILQLTNSPEVVDDILSELSAEIASHLTEKYKDGFPVKSGTASKEGFLQMDALMTRLDVNSLVKINKMISGLTTDQQRSFLAYSVPPPEMLAVGFVRSLSSLTPNQFRVWANIVFPEKKPREKTAFEKEIQKGWTEFKADASEGLGKGGFFASLARKKGLM